MGAGNLPCKQKDRLGRIKLTHTEVVQPCERSLLLVEKRTMPGKTLPANQAKVTPVPRSMGGTKHQGQPKQNEYCLVLRNTLGLGAKSTSLDRPGFHGSEQRAKALDHPGYFPNRTP